MYRSLNPKFDKNDKFNAGMRELELGLLSICCFHLLKMMMMMMTLKLNCHIIIIYNKVYDHAFSQLCCVSPLHIEEIKASTNRNS